MSGDLSEALKKAKDRRGVFSKTIIWESGVSKSQFYRIISGQDAPSIETKQKISDSLGLTSEQFESLFAKSKPEPVSSVQTNPPKVNKRFALIGIGVVMISLAFLITTQTRQPEPRAEQTQVALEGDKTLFITDVTIPDGTAIPVNTTFVKTWRVKNIGNATWKGRYLKRITPASDLICSSPAMVPIPETKPGETIDISVTFKTPHLPGSCRTDWKTADNRGNLYFPDMHGLFSIVTVVGE